MSIRLRTRRWVPSRQLARRSRGLLLGGICLHLRTKWRARDLDRQLATGTDPIASDELSLRAGQLGSQRTRTRLSHVLCRAVELATGRRGPLIATRLRRPDIQATEDLMLALSARLGGGEPVGVAGLAMTSRLVSDRSSPLYRSQGANSLPASLLEALQALDRGHRTAGSAGR
jgi:hypothetical protein